MHQIHRLSGFRRSSNTTHINIVSVCILRQERIQNFHRRRSQHTIFFQKFQKLHEIKKMDRFLLNTIEIFFNVYPKILMVIMGYKRAKIRVGGGGGGMCWVM